jgi:glycosyltransferase involved in cell wall biosynthesis
MLTVCHISPMVNLGGMESMLVDLLTTSKNEQIRHVLLSTASSENVIKPIKESGVLIYEPERKFHYDPMMILKMANWMRGQQIQVVHSYGAVANTWGNLASIIAKIPVYIPGEHGSAWWIRQPTAFFDRWAYQRATTVVVNSKASSKMLHYRYGIDEEKIHLVYNGVASLPEIEQSNIRNEFEISSEHVVGSIGRLDTPKDFKTFVDVAFKVLQKRDDVLFMLVGGGPLEDELRNYVNNLGISEKFIITGWRNDARAIVQIFDVFVSTSIRESFGNVLVEAALAGLPIIAPGIDGIPEVVEDQVTGILVSPTVPNVRYSTIAAATPPSERVVIDGKLDSPKSVAVSRVVREVLHLLDNPALCQEYGSKGKKRAEELFSIETYRNNLEQLYIACAKRFGAYHA